MSLKILVAIPEEDARLLCRALGPMQDINAAREIILPSEDWSWEDMDALEAAAERLQTELEDRLDWD